MSENDLMALLLAVGLSLAGNEDGEDEAMGGVK